MFWNKYYKEIIIGFLVLIFITTGIININKDVKVADSLYNEAVDLYNHNNYSLAKEKIELAVKKCSKIEYREKEKEILYKYYYNLAENDYKNKNYKKAIVNYKESNNYINFSEYDKKIKLCEDAKNKEIALLKNKFRTEKDKFSTSTTIEHINNPKYINVNRTYLYMMQDNNSHWLRFRVCYTGDSWIFWKKMIFNIDGDIQTYTLDYTDIKQDHNVDVWEYADLPYILYKDLIKKIANSKNVSLRLQGDERYYDRTITQSEKNAMKDTIKYYEILEN